MSVLLVPSRSSDLLEGASGWAAPALITYSPAPVRSCASAPSNR